MTNPEKLSLFARFERLYYEYKPFFIVVLAVIVLIGTDWGIVSLSISLVIVCYAGALLFWRHEYRGSLRKLIAGKKQNEGPQSSKETTPTSD